MMMKPFLLAAILMIGLCFCDMAQDTVPAQKPVEKWMTHTYTNIGLQLKLPDWKTDVDDENQMWSLLAYPLVSNPVADVHYRVVLSITKLPEEKYQRLYRKAGTNSSYSAESQQPETIIKTNEFWIYCRRDVCQTNAFAYTCTGRIKRIQNRKAEELESLGGNDHVLAAEIRRILDSIDVISTNLVKKL